ncbi:glycosyltransferase family 4 protein [soil metagenome]
MTPRKVCFVGLENLPVLSREYNQHNIGGEQVQHTLLARAMLKRGYSVSMVVADYGQTDGQSIDGVTVHSAYALDEGIPVLRFVHPRLTGLWSALKRADADIYYVSCAGMQVGVVALFAKLHGKKVVFRIAHDTDCDPENLLIRLWRDKKIYEYGLRRVDAVLAQSIQQMQALRSNYGLPSRIATMLVEPHQRELGFIERDVDVLWVNNLRPFKRPDLALELARRMPHLKFHMIGGPQGGHEAMYEQIRNEAAAIPNLVFHGRVPYHDVNDFYERAKVFVNTSDSEGFPNSYLQAWRRGTPLVAFFDPDSVIQRNRLGANPASMQDMVKSVHSLTASREEWERVSAQCRRFMDDNYGDDKVLEPYLEVMKAVPGAA